VADCGGDRCGPRHGARLSASGGNTRARSRAASEGAAEPAISVEVSTDPTLAKPAICGTVSTDAASPAPTRAPSASACEPYRELIVEALGRGRNAVAIWQDLVDDHGFFARYASVRRFVLKLRGAAPAEARVVITTAPAKKARSTTGMAVRWSATGVPGSTDARGSSS
jgi:hypothetical protein